MAEGGLPGLAFQAEYLSEYEGPDCPELSGAVKVTTRIVPWSPGAKVTVPPWACSRLATMVNRVDRQVDQGGDRVGQDRVGLCQEGQQDKCPVQRTGPVAGEVAGGLVAKSDAEVAWQGRRQAADQGQQGGHRVRATVQGNGTGQARQQDGH